MQGLNHNLLPKNKSDDIKKTAKFPSSDIMWLLAKTTGVDPGHEFGFA